MEYCVRLSDLGALAPAERDGVLGQLTRVASAPINGQALLVKARIASFETRYEMSSADMIVRLGRSEIEETAEYAEWLFWLRLHALSVPR